MVLLDTLRASRRLREVGFEEEQAGAIVATLTEDVGDQIATTADIRRLEEKMDHMEERLDQRMTIRMGVTATAATSVLLAAIGIATGFLATT